MSHTVSIKTLFKDAAALAAACSELGIAAPIAGSARLYEDLTQHHGLIVRLPDWTFPIVINTATGEAKFDNYGGAWGAQSEMDKLTHAYAVNKATIEARKRGYIVTRKQGKNGSTQLVVTGF